MAKSNYSLARVKNSIPGGKARQRVKEPLIKSRVAATAAWRDAMQGARRKLWPLPLRRRATPQGARQPRPVRVAANCGVCGVALLGFVVRPGLGLAQRGAGRGAEGCVRYPGAELVRLLPQAGLRLTGRSRATTFVARLAAIRILPATRLTKDLIRGSRAHKIVPDYFGGKKD